MCVCVYVCMCVCVYMCVCVPLVQRCKSMTTSDARSALFGLQGMYYVVCVYMYVYICVYVCVCVCVYVCMCLHDHLGC
jgi:hypothetical protein